MEGNIKKVEIKFEDDMCILKFNLSKNIQVNLYENDTTQLKKLFNVLIKDLLDASFKLELVVDEDTIENKLALEVCELYIEDLNTEITNFVENDEFNDVKLIISDGK